ncbi:histidine phosphatase family protein [Paenibacillus sp. DMB20]|uniref:histidine phosphatase family protein n=1 Tax=Paenibacillus sp. DMB20 TaxID=1642570 RepID=UPI0006279082|nr:histidine phosphatase family protein [Paenibacillus sp. DMB20]KKO52705.1 hypothetical protein XI25_17895 [Paenibacillus sp. DMB20]
MAIYLVRHGKDEEGYRGGWSDRGLVDLYFSSLRMDERYPGGESPIENYMRIEEAFNELCGEHIDHTHNKNILVVRHGGVINIVYYILKNIKWTNKNKFFPASNTGIHRIERVNGKWELTLENQTAHL